MQHPRDPQEILLRLMATTSDVGSATILGLARIYLMYGEEQYRSAYRRPGWPSSVESYFDSKELHPPDTFYGVEKNERNGLY
jgi:hypothetical protein